MLCSCYAQAVSVLAKVWQSYLHLFQTGNPAMHDWVFASVTRENKRRARVKELDYNHAQTHLLGAIETLTGAVASLDARLAYAMPSLHNICMTPFHSSGPIRPVLPLPVTRV